MHKNQFTMPRKSETTGHTSMLFPLSALLLRNSSKIHQTAGYNTAEFSYMPHRAIQITIFIINQTLPFINLYCVLSFFPVSDISLPFRLTTISISRSDMLMRSGGDCGFDAVFNRPLQISEQNIQGYAAGICVLCSFRR